MMTCFFRFLQILRALNAGFFVSKNSLSATATFVTATFAAATMAAATMAAATMAFLAVCASPARAQNVLYAPAVDPTVFRDDAVRRTQNHYGDWLADCNEIIPLQKRFCNLMAPMRDSAGVLRGQFLLTTDRAGKAGVLMKIGAPLDVRQPIVILTSYAIKGKKRPLTVKYEKKVTPYLCETDCQFVFPLEGELLFALNEGSAVSIVVRTATSSDWRTANFSEPKTLSLSTEDFGRALRENSKAQGAAHP